jgi:hypothetical protein
VRNSFDALIGPRLDNPRPNSNLGRDSHSEIFERRKEPRRARVCRGRSVVKQLAQPRAQRGDVRLKFADTLRRLHDSERNAKAHRVAAFDRVAHVLVNWADAAERFARMRTTEIGL